MTATKTTDLAALTSVDAAADFLFIVDTSDTSMAASGTTKKLLPSNLPLSTAMQTALDLKAALISPSFTTPTLGVASATTVNKVALTAPATGCTVTIVDGKTFTCSNTLTLAGTDGSTLNVGTGGTLGTAAYTATGAYAAASHTHAASDIASGTIATARLGSGTANSTTFLRGDQTYAVPTAAAPTECFIIAVGDEETAITTGTAKVVFRMPYAFTLTAVRASLSVASSGGIPTIDINEGDSATTILSTKLTIDANEKTSTTAATAAVISDASLADDAQISIDIDVAGTGAAGLKVYLIGAKT